MSDGILKEVLQLEQQIEENLGREQQRADLWLAEACRAIDQDLRFEQKEIERVAREQNTETIRSARQRAAKKLYQERHWARTVVSLPKDTLLPLLENQLKAVLYGRDDDCPDDKG